VTPKPARETRAFRVASIKKDTEGKIIFDEGVCAAGVQLNKLARQLDGGAAVCSAARQQPTRGYAARVRSGLT
jgi:hypothetical protein